jgi:hypothetical protein
MNEFAVRPFISYAREDQKVAIELFNDLTAAGAQPWLDIRCLRGGDDWELAVRNAIRASSHCLVLLSSNALAKRGFIQKEIRLALEVLEELPPGHLFLIPTRLDACEPKHLQLQKLHWIDCFPSYESGLREVLRSLGLSLSSDELSASGAPAKQVGAVTYKSVYTNYRLGDERGHLARVQMVQTIEAHETVSEFYTVGPAGAGSIKNITANLGSISVRREGGAIAIVTNLDKPLEAGSIVDHVLSWEGIDSFTEATESVAQNISRELDETGIHVFLPQSRPARSAEAFVHSKDGRRETVPLSVNTGTELSLVMERPRVGSRLVVMWTW